MAVNQFPIPSGFSTERVAAITTTSTWTHPDGASVSNPKKIIILAMGGGGGGGAGTGNFGGGGGGGAGIVRKQTLVITAPISITIGAGGNSSVSGGDTIVGSFSAPGGGAGGSPAAPGSLGLGAYNIAAGPAYGGGSGGSQGGDSRSAPAANNASSYGIGPRSLSSIYQLQSEEIFYASGGGAGGAAYNVGSTPTAAGSGLLGNGGAGATPVEIPRAAPLGGPYVGSANAATPGNGYGAGGGGGSGPQPGGSGTQGIVYIFY